MTVIELSDEQAAALRARAAAQGLTLEAWLQKLASQDIRGRKGRYKLSELIAQCDPDAPYRLKIELGWTALPLAARLEEWSAAIFFTSI